VHIEQKMYILWWYDRGIESELVISLGYGIDKGNWACQRMHLCVNWDYTLKYYIFSPASCVAPEINKNISNYYI
jgi:hypothetical protein